MDHPTPSDPSSYLQYPPVSESCSSAELVASDSSDRERKRNAKYGQWRTPPQPFFPSSTVGTTGTVTASAAVPLAAPSSEVDVSGLDLASLQEAYRRGMAAAAALSKHQRETGQIVLGNVDHTCTDGDIISNLNSVQSCPNFMLMPLQQQAPMNTSTCVTMTSSQHIPPQPNTTTQQYVPIVPYAAAAVPGTSTRITTANPTATHHPLASTMSNSTVPTIPAATAKAIPAVTRSISLPDITKGSASNAVGSVPSASTEEEKRIKRLARNRASARLRRLRKKNLVESYEEQVTVLEQSLAKLQAHKWGDPESNHSALIDALSMERGQQPLTAENRREVIKQILEQQKEQVKNLMDVQMEGWMLRWLATHCQQQQQQHPTVGNIGDEENLLADELQNVLNLSPEQMELLKKATEGIEEEKHAIDTVNVCLEAMMNNSWLVNQEVEESSHMNKLDTIDQFTSIMNQSQFSKFLLWTDHNSEAIEQLDFVNAPSESALPANAPNFMFGIDDMMGQHDDMGGDDAASGK